MKHANDHVVGRAPHLETAFKAFDGVSIFYRYWQPIIDEKDAPTIILLHRGHEHSGRMMHLVDELNLPQCQFFAMDSRGHGHSDGERGDAKDFTTLVRDLDCFVKHLNQDYHIKNHNIIIIAQSVGAVIASTWVHDYIPNIRALILGAPAFNIKLYVPFAKTGLKVLKKVKGNFFVNSYIKPFLLTRDESRIDTYKKDPLITHRISAQVLLSLYVTSARLIKNASTIYTPTQILVSGSDYVVKKKQQKQFFDNISSTIKEYHVLPDFYHDIFGEKKRDLVISKIRRFVCASLQKPVQIHNLKNADSVGESKAEFEKLSLPDSSKLKRLYWQLIRRVMKSVGPLSQGIELGFEKGFDSGGSLDYVYLNKPSGKTKVGQWIDRQYLNSIGWRGIRIRKAHLEQLLVLYIKKLQSQSQAVNLVDLAAGHGRYILDSIQQLDTYPNAVLLRDYLEQNVEQGKELIKSRNLSHIVSFEQGDAFNRNELANLEFKPSLAVISGLYELFENNDQVMKSLLGLSESMELGGYLIYTGQPWHPQLEFIARVLTSHKEGKAWVMRRRSQAELDQLIVAAGFCKIDMRIDPWGIFTVSVAQKIR